MSASLASLLMAASLTMGGAPEKAPEAGGRDRAIRNYEAVLSGEKRMTQLTREEVWALIQLDRRQRERYLDRRSARERCIDEEIDNLGGRPTYLALRTIDLKCSQR